MAMPSFMSKKPVSQDPVTQINEALASFSTIRDKLVEANGKIDTKIAGNNTLVEQQRASLVRLEQQTAETNAALAAEQARASNAIGKLTEIIG